MATIRTGTPTGRTAVARPRPPGPHPSLDIPDHLVPQAHGMVDDWNAQFEGVDWNDYGQRYPELQPYWEANTYGVRDRNPTLEDFFKSHYTEHGALEGRQLHAPPPPPDTSGGGGDTSGGSGQPQSVTNQWLQALWGRLGEDGTSIGGLINRPAPTRDDPIVRAQTDAYSAQQERARRLYLQELAEQAGPYGNLRGEERMSAERMGQNVGAFEAELLAREYESRRAELMQALAMSGQWLTASAARELQEQIATLDRELLRLNSDRELALRRAGL